MSVPLRRLQMCSSVSSVVNPPARSDVKSPIQDLKLRKFDGADGSHSRCLSRHRRPPESSSHPSHLLAKVALDLEGV